jgi:hypothetical protein
MNSNEKSKEARTREGVTILRKLRDLGMYQSDFVFMDINQAISKWVKTGEASKNSFAMPREGRIAVLTLPSSADAIAELVLRVAP